jgi:hypothetical protein
MDTEHEPEKQKRVGSNESDAQQKKVKTDCCEHGADVHVFQHPTKQIFNASDLDAFLHSETYEHFVEFIIALSNSVLGKPISSVQAPYNPVFVTLSIPSHSKKGDSKVARYP